MAADFQIPTTPMVTPASQTGTTTGVQPSINPGLAAMMGQPAQPLQPRPVQAPQAIPPQVSWLKTQPFLNRKKKGSGEGSFGAGSAGSGGDTGSSTGDDTSATGEDDTSSSSATAAPITPATQSSPSGSLPAPASGNIVDLVRQRASANGIDPTYALATAERESNFQPGSGGTGSIRGMYQMTGGLRSQYGIGDSSDPTVQTDGFSQFTKDLRGEMSSVLGRDPTWEETYAGHHFGGTRAARMISNMDPNTPVTAVFTPRELAGNPHIRRADTVGNLLQQTQSDMAARRARYAQGQGGEEGAGEDLSAHGNPVEEGPKGQLEPGNIDLNHRPVVKNDDGTISTVRSMSFNENGKEILVPTVSDDGRILSNADAIDLYHKTGQHLGIFDTPDNANSFAQSLHEQQQQLYAPAPNVGDFESQPEAG